MSHVYRLPPVRKAQPQRRAPVTIRSKPLFDDFVQLANLYQIAFPNFNLQMKINSVNSAIDTALTFFSMIEDNYFPLEHMWEWSDEVDDYEGTIRPWLLEIPVRVVSHDQGQNHHHMIEPKALLARLAEVGNYSPSANEHKQTLRCQYPTWKWDNLLDTFQLSKVIKTLDEMFLPPPFENLPALIKYMTHESDTYFLDYGLEDWPHHIMWNEFNLNWLASDWETAKRIMDQSDALCSWLKKNPDQLEKIWTILAAAHNRRHA